MVKPNIVHIESILVLSTVLISPHIAHMCHLGWTRRRRPWTGVPIGRRGVHVVVSSRGCLGRERHSWGVWDWMVQYWI